MIILSSCCCVLKYIPGSQGGVQAGIVLCGDVEPTAGAGMNAEALNLLTHNPRH